MSGPKPIKFDESEYFIWLDRRESEAQARKALTIRERERESTNELLWGLGYIVVMPLLVAAVCWIGGKLL